MEIDKLLDQARALSCSDLHFTVGLPPVVRRNGVLQQLEEYSTCTQEQIQAVISAIASPKHRAHIEKGHDCDFTYVSSAGLRHRVNVYRQRGHSAIALRLLQSKIPTLESLSLPSVLGDFALRPRGLVLVTGPTGSGKSTTLAAMIDHINRKRNSHVLIIEDPIEYLHQHNQCMINQREIGEDVESFSTALRSALREDPDVILVGEMRDYETISAAITAAETGHLVMSTLHTTDAASTIDRIIDVFPPHQQQQIRTQLASVLVGIVSQQLIPKADGSGRVAALEILAQTDAVRTMIRDNKVHQIPNAILTGKGVGMQARDQVLGSYAQKGIITSEEALARCSSTEDLKRFMGGANLPHKAPSLISSANPFENR